MLILASKSDPVLFVATRDPAGVATFWRPATRATLAHIFLKETAFLAPDTRAARVREQSMQLGACRVDNSQINPGRGSSPSCADPGQILLGLWRL